MQFIDIMRSSLKETSMPMKEVISNINKSHLNQRSLFYFTTHQAEETLTELRGHLEQFELLFFDLYLKEAEVDYTQS